MIRTIPDALTLDTSQTVKIPVPEKVAKYVDDFLKENIVKFSNMVGTYEQQKCGFISETMTHFYLFGVYKKLVGGFDNGIDFVYKGFNVDVKTSTRLCYIKRRFCALYMKKQLKYPTDIVIFNNYNTSENVLELCGWLFTKDISRYGNKISKGGIKYLDNNQQLISKYDNFDINYENLNSIEILENL